MVLWSNKISNLEQNLILICDVLRTQMSDLIWDDAKEHFISRDREGTCIAIAIKKAVFLAIKRMLQTGGADSYGVNRVLGAARPALTLSRLRALNSIIMCQATDFLNTLKIREYTSDMSDLMALAVIPYRWFDYCAICSKRNPTLFGRVKIIRDCLHAVCSSCFRRQLIFQCPVCEKEISGLMKPERMKLMGIAKLEGFQEAVEAVRDRACHCGCRGWFINCSQNSNGKPRVPQEEYIEVSGTHMNT